MPSFAHKMIISAVTCGLLLLLLPDGLSAQDLPPKSPEKAAEAKTPEGKEAAGKESEKPKEVSAEDKSDKKAADKKAADKKAADKKAAEMKEKEAKKEPPPNPLLSFQTRRSRLLSAKKFMQSEIMMNRSRKVMSPTSHA